jgi:hypothetical protein
MRSAWMYRGPDRWESRANLGLGAAALLSLGLFAGAMIRVTEQAPRIAQVIGERAAGTNVAMVATRESGTNHTGRPALPGIPRAGSKSRPVMSGPI